MNYAFSKYAEEAPVPPAGTTPDKNKSGLASVGNNIKNWAQRFGEHVAANKYGYAGAAIGATAGVPVGLGIANMTDMMATEKVLTTILSSVALASAAGYYGHTKDASEKSPEKSTGGSTGGSTGSASTPKPESDTYSKIKGALSAVGGHLSRNRGKYIGGAAGMLAAVPAGAAIADMTQMNLTEKIITMIATGLATTGTGIAVGDYMDRNRANV